MARKSGITFNSKNGKEIYERMVRVETKIDEIKAVLGEIKEWQEKRGEQIEEHDRFISSQRVLNKIYWVLLSALLTGVVGIIIKSVVG